MRNLSNLGGSEQFRRGHSQIHDVSCWSSPGIRKAVSGRTSRQVVEQQAGLQAHKLVSAPCGSSATWVLLARGNQS